MGPPIEVERVQNPTDEQISGLHEKFTKHLIKLFEQEKHKYVQNPEKTELIIE